MAPEVVSGNEKRIRKYSPSATGPFLIVAENENPKGFLHATKIAILLNATVTSDSLKFEVMSKQKMKIYAKTAIIANDIVQMRIDGVKLSIPMRLVEVLGTTEIHPDVSDEELKNLKTYNKFGIPSGIAVIDTRRMRDAKQQPMWRVVVTFEGTQLPTHLELYNCIYPVRQYLYPVRLCDKCWRYGHLGKFCKSKPRCCQCGSIDHTLDTCHNEMSCVNCRGRHLSNDRNCPEFVKRKRLDNRETAFSQGRTNSPSINVAPVDPFYNTFDSIQYPSLQVTSKTNTATLSNTVPPKESISKLEKKRSRKMLEVEEQISGLRVMAETVIEKLNTKLVEVDISNLLVTIPNTNGQEGVPETNVEDLADAESVALFLKRETILSDIRSQIQKLVEEALGECSPRL